MADQPNLDAIRKRLSVALKFGADVRLDADAAAALRELMELLPAILTALDTAHARIAELEAALMPFAEKATKWEANHPKQEGRYCSRNSVQLAHRLGDFRAARTALNKEPDNG
jgi:sugar/nucleoside kinase (ribokinase family)